MYLRRSLLAAFAAFFLSCGPAHAYEGESPVPLDMGGTDTSLTAPGADRILFWDHSDLSADWLSLGTGLSISGTTLELGIGTALQAWDADLDAIAALGSTGIAVRTGSNTWAQRTLTGTALEIEISNGDGVSGNPTIGLPDAVSIATSLDVADTLRAEETGCQGQYVVVGPYSATLGGDDCAQFNITENVSTGIALFRFGIVSPGSGAIGEFGAGGTDSGTWDDIVFYNTKGAFPQVWQIDAAEAMRIRTDLDVAFTNDLRLVEGASLNWDDGDCVLTQTGNSLDTTGCTISVASLDTIDLGTDTAGDYVATVADGIGIDGTASGEGSTYTPSLDLTEINSATFGSGTFTTLTFDAGATDPVWTYGSGLAALTSANLLIGHTADISVSQTSALQVVGTTANAASMTLARFANSAGASAIQNQAHSRGATIGDYTVVQDNDQLATFRGWGSDGTDFALGAEIMFAVDGTPGDNDMPGEINFRTSADGAAAVTTRWSIGSAGHLVPGADATYDIGTSSVGINDLHLGASGVVNFDGNDVTITHSANALAFAGVTDDYTFDDTVKPATNDGGALGDTSNRWADGFFADGAVLNMGTTSSRVTITHNAASDSISIEADPDGSTASSQINLRVDGAAEAILNGTNFTPGANDGNALGASGTAWADLWLAAGGLVEFNGATDSSFTCASGDCSIEGQGIYRAGGTDVALADGGTGASLADPNADRLMLWDDSAGAVVFAGVGTGLSISATPTLDLDSDLQSWAGVTRASGFDTFAATPSCANLSSLLTDEVFSCSDAELGALAGLTSAANRVPYFTGSGTAGLINFAPSDANLDVLVGWDDSDSQYESLSLATIATEASPASGDFLLIYGAEGDLRKVDWNSLPGASGLPGDPNVDAIAVWDDTEGAVNWFSVHTGLDLNLADSRLELDFTELNSFTLGAGSATGIIFDAGATDPAIEVSSGTFTIDIGGTNEITLTSTAFSPGVSDGNALGTTSLQWSDLFGATGFVWNIANGNWIATHTSGILTVGTGDLRVTTAGTNTASVVTVGGTQTLTGKSIAAGQITSGTLNIGTGNAATVGTIELGDASDTTIARASAGQATIEGRGILTVIGVQSLTSGSGATYTPTAGTKHVKVTCTGGGGGGGGGDASTTTDDVGAGGGGEAGGTAIAWFDATELGANAVYTIGTGGGGGSNVGGDGTDGNDTSFNPAGTGATLTAEGGDAGDGSGTSTFTTRGRAGGSGEGVASGGDVNLPGGDGGAGDGYDAFVATGGVGGASFWGGGSGANDAAQASCIAGINGGAPGSGGGGGACAEATAGAVGGDGAAGICVVEEFG